MGHCLLIVIVTVISFTAVYGNDDDSGATDYALLATDIYDEVFQGYNQHFRPSNQTNVAILLSLSSIVDLNEQEGHITTTFITTMVWTDPRLTWNLSDKPLDHLQVPESDIWVPDVELMNRFKESLHDTAMKPITWLHHNGKIYYLPSRTYQTPCAFDMSNFPYDTQHCQVILGSWAYLQNEVDFNLVDEGIAYDLYNPHSDFTLTSLTVTKHEELFGNGSIPFVELIVDITLDRRPSFFYYMYLLPVNVLLFAIPLGHCLPARSPARFIVLGVVLLSTIMMLNSLVQFMPGYSSPTTPKILKFYLSCCFCMMSSAVASCITLSLTNTNARSKRVPLVLRELLFKRYLLCFEKAQNPRDFEFQLLNLERAVQNRMDAEQEITPGDGEANSEVSNRQQPIVAVLQQLVTELQLARYRDQVTLEWLKLARFLDSLFCIAFLIAALVVISTMHRSASD